MSKKTVRTVSRLSSQSLMLSKTWRSCKLQDKPPRKPNYSFCTMSIPSVRIFNRARTTASTSFDTFDRVGSFGGAEAPFLDFGMVTTAACFQQSGEYWKWRTTSMMAQYFFRARGGIRFRTRLIIRFANDDFPLDRLPIIVMIRGSPSLTRHHLSPLLVDCKGNASKYAF